MSKRKNTVTLVGQVTRAPFKSEGNAIYSTVIDDLGFEWNLTSFAFAPDAQSALLDTKTDDYIQINGRVSGYKDRGYGYMPTVVTTSVKVASSF